MIRYDRNFGVVSDSSCLFPFELEFDIFDRKGLNFSGVSGFNQINDNVTWLGPSSRD